MRDDRPPLRRLSISRSSRSLNSSFMLATSPQRRRDCVICSRHPGRYSTAACPCVSSELGMAGRPQQCH